MAKDYAHIELTPDEVRIIDAYVKAGDTPAAYAVLSGVVDRLSDEDAPSSYKAWFHIAGQINGNISVEDSSSKLMADTGTLRRPRLSHSNDVEVAEGVRFELTVRLHVQRFSRPSQSATLAPLRRARVSSAAERRGQ